VMEHGRRADQHEADRRSALVEIERTQGEVERLKADLDGRDRSLAEATARHESARLALAGEFEAARIRREAEQAGRQDEWERERRQLADDHERRVVSERDRLEAEQRDRQEEHAVALQQADEERRILRQDLDRLGDEIRVGRDQVEALERGRVEDERRLEAIEAERERLSSERDDWQGRLEAAGREFDRQSAAHREDLAHLGDEFDSLRAERDAALGRIDELSRDRDRLAALRDEARGTHEEAERARQSELARLAEERASLDQQLEAERRRNAHLAEQLEALQAELDQDRNDWDAEHQAYEQVMDSLRTKQGTAYQTAETTKAPAADLDPSVEIEQGLADHRLRLQQAEQARSVLNDALKAARNELEAMSTKLYESQLEQKRIRSILVGMGIHLY
jgi:chromosome segregation ATPase